MNTEINKCLDDVAGIGFRFFSCKPGLIVELTRPQVLEWLFDYGCQTIEYKGHNAREKSSDVEAAITRKAKEMADYAREQRDKNPGYKKILGLYLNMDLAETIRLEHAGQCLEIIYS